MASFFPVRKRDRETGREGDAVNTIIATGSDGHDGAWPSKKPRMANGRDARSTVTVDSPGERRQPGRSPYREMYVRGRAPKGFGVKDPGAQQENGTTEMVPYNSM
jgi:hypothetical protein